MTTPESRNPAKSSATATRLTSLLESIIQVRAGLVPGFVAGYEKMDEMARLAADALLTLGDGADLPSEKAKPEWVRCGEAKPNVYDSILLTDGVERITGFLCPSGEWARHDGGEWNPTHWMQLPACPERNCEGKS